MVVSEASPATPSRAGVLIPSGRRAIWLVLSVLGPVAFPYLVWVSHGSFGYDARAYWQVNLGALYAGTSGNLDQLGAFRYAPPIAVLFTPFALLSWPTFLTLWTGLLIGCVAVLGRRRNALAIAGFPPVAMELHYGNVNLPIAVCAAFGFSYPALWAFVLLTKPTCAVGLLWFALRRDWRALTWAVGLAAAVAVPTMILRPDLWFGYVTMLMNDAGVQQPLPLLWRLPLAVVLVAWGARTDRRWVVPLAVAVAVPKLSWSTLSMLAGVVPVLLTRTRATSVGLDVTDLPVCATTAAVLPPAGSLDTGEATSVWMGADPHE